MKENTMDWKNVDNFEEIPDAQGLYWISIKASAQQLSGIQVPVSGLIYIGKSRNLYNRLNNQHFRSGRTGSSALRRTLGALLKDKLELIAIPRGHGLNEQDYTHYRFTRDGEGPLTNWMKENLQIKVCLVPENLHAAEIIAIDMYHPVLNIQHWPNPNIPYINSMHRICVDEALKNRQI